jgi:hypothetical protein
VAIITQAESARGGSDWIGMGEADLHMIRRILTAALGGIAGVALFFAGLAAGHALLLLFIARLWPIWMLIAVGCGGFAMRVGEKFGIVPSTEDNQKLGPVRLFDQRNSNS